MSKKILVVRFSSIGDIVLTTPVVRCLKLQLGAEIHFLTKQQYQSILSANPYIDQIWTINNNIKEITSELKKEKYDYLIDLHHNLRTWQLKQQLRVPHFSFNKLNKEKWLLTNFKINRLPTIHIVDRYLATVQQLGATNDGQGLDYFIPPSDQINPLTYHPDLQPNQYIVLTVGAGFNTKQLPVSKIVAICEQIPFPVVLIGGKLEISKSDIIKNKTKRTLITLCGKLNLNQSASLIQQSKAVIAHDTGMMHIAAALKKYVISIWGNTIPEFGMSPYYPTPQKACHTIVEVKGLSCRPCSKLGHNKCPKGHFKCMNNINEKAVLKPLTQNLP